MFLLDIDRFYTNPATKIVVATFFCSVLLMSHSTVAIVNQSSFVRIPRQLLEDKALQAYVSLHLPTSSHFQPGCFVILMLDDVDVRCVLGGDGRLLGVEVVAIRRGCELQNFLSIEQRP